MKDVLNFIEQEKDKFLSELFEFLRFPSISSKTAHKPDMAACGNWLVSHLKNIGMGDARLVETPGHPIVFASWMGAGENAPTLLIYGHYDVQPVDPLKLWGSPPFEPQIRNGRIYGRGTADDKGQVFMHVKAIEAYLKIEKKLPVNIKLLFEGEEEAKESNLDNFIKDNAELLKCDTVLVSDTEWFASGLPTICYALRGIAFTEVVVTGPNRDVHSGSFGGAIDNPLNTLCWMVTQMKDKYGRITIPGFYDDVLDLTNEERENFKKLPYNEEEYCKDLDINGVNGEYGFTTLERSWARPTLDLNGIFGGYIEEGNKTIIPSKATAKISYRLVPNQKAEDIAKKAEAYLKKIAPPTVKVEVFPFAGGNPVLTPIDSKSITAAKSALKQAFGKEPVFMREGGSIPVCELFDTVLNAPTVLMGFSLPADNIHSPNESFAVENFFGGIKTVVIYMKEIEKLKD